MRVARDQVGRAEPDQRRRRRARTRRGRTPRASSSWSSSRREPRLPCGSAIEEGRDARIRAVIAQLARVTERDHALRFAVEHDAALGDREDARQLVRHDHERRAEAARVQREDQLVELDRGDRVEPGARLVQEEQRRLERERARDARRASSCRPRAPPAGGSRSRSDRRAAACCARPRRCRRGVSSVQVASGSATFSASVIEPNSAPDWNSTPKSGAREPSDGGWPSTRIVAAHRLRRARSGGAAASTCRSRCRRGSRRSPRAGPRSRGSRASTRSPKPDRERPTLVMCSVRVHQA